MKQIDLIVEQFNTPPHAYVAALDPLLPQAGDGERAKDLKAAPPAQPRPPAPTPEHATPGKPSDEPVPSPQPRPAAPPPVHHVAGDGCERVGRGVSRERRL